MTKRAIIVDDHGYFRTVLRQLLAHCDDIEVVAEAVDGSDAVELVAKYRPDVVLMDINMPELDGAEACSRMKVASPNVPVILYTASDISDLVRRTALAADALLGKQDLFTDLPPILKQVVDQNDRGEATNE